MRRSTLLCSIYSWPGCQMMSGFVSVGTGNAPSGSGIYRRYHGYLVTEGRCTVCRKDGAVCGRNDPVWSWSWATVTVNGVNENEHQCRHRGASGCREDSAL